MHRFYADLMADGIARLTPEDAKHALKVLRLSPGDEVELISDGLRYRAILRNDAVLEVKEPLASTETALRITLFQGLPKGDKMDWIVQKAVEIGINRIVPVRMNRCVVRLSEPDAGKKQLRWSKISREAGKQSGRCLIPEVSVPVSLRDVKSMAKDLDACIVPWEEAKDSGPLSFMQSHPDIQSLGILIGPEGGIEPSEIDFLGSAFFPVTLGPRILRTETAGLAAAAAVLAVSGEMG